jgi:protein O-mannosyl-transferase
MSVVSNIFILIGTVLGERFLLVASMAFSISLVFLLGRVTRTDLKKINFKKSPLFLSLTGLLLLVYSVKTITRNSDWKDNLTLFEADINTVPNSTRAQALLGFEYFTRCQSVPDASEKIEYYNKAKACFEKSIQIYPGNNWALYNYGVMEYAFGKLPESEILYRKAAEADTNNFNSWNNLCVVAVQLNQFDSALRYYQKLLYFKPNDPAILSDMGVICEQKKDYKKSIKYFEKSLAIDPTRKVTYDNMIGLMNWLGDTAEVRHYSKQKAEY